MPVLLDTHALNWFDGADPKMGSGTRAVIDGELARQQVWICPVSWWETQCGIDRGRISLGVSIDRWRLDLLAAGYQERPIGGVDTILQARLADFHKDPAERLLVAVAINARMQLVTADAKILAWPGTLDRLDART